MAKNLVLGPILAPLAQIRAAKFFLKKSLASSVYRYHGHMVRYHHAQYRKKTHDQILKKISDGRTDGQNVKQEEPKVQYEFICWTRYGLIEFIYIMTAVSTLDKTMVNSR